MKPTPIEFFDALAIADVAARALQAERNTPHTLANVPQRCRMLCREPAVRALRYLWSTGDASQRQTVAARVNIWLGHHHTPGRGTESLMKRVHARETARLAAAPSQIAA